MIFKFLMRPPNVCVHMCGTLQGQIVTQMRYIYMCVEVFGQHAGAIGGFAPPCPFIIDDKLEGQKVNNKVLQ